MLRPAVLFCAFVALSSLIVTAAEAKPEGTLKQIASRGTILMGYRIDAPPFSFQNDKKEPIGYSIDLCNAIAARIAVTLKKPELNRKFIAVTADERLKAVQKGRIDIECGVTTVTLSRRAEVDFTNIVFITGGGVMLRKGDDVESLKDLKHKRIAVIRGTTIEGALVDRLAKAEIKPDFISVKSMDEALSALTDRKADAVAEDRLVLLGLAQTRGLKDKVALPPFLYSYEPYAFPVRRNDAAFRLVADQALADLFRSGEIWEIYDRWIGALGAKPSEDLGRIFSLQAVPE